MTPFEVEVVAGAVADVLVDVDEPSSTAGVVEVLDRHGIRAVAPRAPARARTAAPMSLEGYSGVVCRALTDEVAVAAERLGLPRLAVAVPSSPALIEAFCQSVLGCRCPRRRYAFFIGRLERDFAQAREAMRVAVESEAGLDFLWIDDGRHTTNVAGIRERTRLLIQHAVFIVADLTLGVENPVHENPSRAHEIGLAIGYERPICLSSQEPRRYPYFSIADMQMTFWTREEELEASVRAWVRSQGRLVANRVLNHALRAPLIPEPTFQPDPARGFIGPNLANGHPAFRR